MDGQTYVRGDEFSCARVGNMEGKRDGVVTVRTLCVVGE